jgi:hypothetical protein
MKPQKNNRNLVLKTYTRYKNLVLKINTRCRKLVLKMYTSLCWKSTRTNTQERHREGEEKNTLRKYELKLKQKHTPVVIIITAGVRFFLFLQIFQGTGKGRP